MSKAILLLDEMPVRCIDCPCMYVVKNSHTSESDYCKATNDKGFYLRIENICERPKWCPLKPLPKCHGRLIDADEAIQVLKSLGNRDYRREKGTIQDAIKMLSYDEYTPTIIEADKGEE